MAAFIAFWRTVHTRPILLLLLYPQSKENNPINQEEQEQSVCGLLSLSPSVHFSYKTRVVVCRIFGHSLLCHRSSSCWSCLRFGFLSSLSLFRFLLFNNMCSARRTRIGPIIAVEWIDLGAGTWYRNLVKLGCAAPACLPACHSRALKVRPRRGEGRYQSGTVIEKCWVKW